MEFSGKVALVTGAGSGVGETTAYAGTKATQAAIANPLALVVGRHRIRVNAVAPGSTRTNLGENTADRNAEAARVPASFPEGDVPLTGGRPTTAEEVADAVVMLCSDRARHVTGTLLFVDGGRSLLR